MLAKKTIKAVIFLMALTSAVTAFSQNNRVGTWEVLNGELFLNRRWNLWFETQTRSQKFIDDFYYHELKFGVNYKLNKNAAVFVGTGQYATYANGGNFKSPVATHEFRLWEQLLVNNYIGRIKMEHRYRIEQRWVNHVFRNRFRYRINPIIPINHSTIKKGTLFATLHDEVFLTDKGQYFERNRVFGGLGYMISNPLTIQVGWMNQFDHSPTYATTNKNWVQTTLFFRLNQKKATANQPPLAFVD